MIEPTRLPDLKILERTRVRDERGFFERIASARELEEVIGTRSVRQVNRTFTRNRGSVRGLHFQERPGAELKIVTCIRGSVYDVAVDVRAGSPTFLQWHSTILSAEHPRSFVIPEGFAHGFQTLEDECELVYVHTADYAPTVEGGISPLDESLAIPWPEPIAMMSERDRSLPSIADGFAGIDV